MDEGVAVDHRGTVGCNLGGGGRGDWGNFMFVSINDKHVVTSIGQDRNAWAQAHDAESYLYWHGQEISKAVS